MSAGRGLLVHSGAVGDFILALRVAEAMRMAGAASVAVLGRPAVASVALGRGVDETIDIEAGGAHAIFHPDLALPKALREKLSGRDPVVLMIPGADRVEIAARRLAQSTGGRVITIDPRARPGWNAHITEQWLEDLRAAGMDGVPGPPRIAIAEADTRRARAEWLRAGEGRIALLHPGSGGRAKCWPMESFVGLARELGAAGIAVAFLLGPVEEESWGAEKFSALTADHHVVRGKTLAEAAELVSAADVFIGNDSGITHLAAAVGTPTVAIFGASDPALWRPLGDRVRALGGKGWPTAAEAMREIEGMG